MRIAVQVRGFPYLVVYRVGAHDLLIVAVAHAKRRPGYWARRLGGTGSRLSRHSRAR
jgi:hypothetical protein